jgi:hypothetical protein
LLVGSRDGEFEDQRSSKGLKSNVLFVMVHYSASCEKVVTVSERKAILKKAWRCFRCLYMGHHIRDCRGPRNCRHYYSGQHHQSICTMHETNSLATNPDSKAEDQETPGETSRVTMTSAASTTKRHVLLQTAHATAVNVDGSKSLAVKILFDSGSQRPYITDSLRSKLDLKPEKSETLHLNIFGDSKYKTQKCQVFTLNFEIRHGEISPISALNFPVICTPFETKFDISKYPHLQDLDLADCPSDDRRYIDVLIGSDHYWDFITGEVNRGGGEWSPCKC